MGSQREKKLAVANAATLNEMLAIGGAINVVALLALFVLHRPQNKVPFVVFSVPGLGSHFLLEKFGRPSYNGPQLVHAGQEIKGPGLYEYMFDVVYVTWILDVLMVLFGSNKVWWLYLAIPVFAAYKVYGLASPFLSRKKPVQEEKVPEKSKRQAKMEQRREKGQVRYR